MSVSLRELVKPVGRKCGMAIHLRNRTIRSKHMVIGALCGSWKCDTCGPHLREKWTNHLSGRIQEAGTVFVSLVSKLRWQTLATRIRRAGKQFATVEQVDGILLVFTTFQVGEAVVAPVAITMLEKAIWGAVAERRPVHTSRGWGLPKAVPKLSDWERVCKLSITVDEAESAVKAAGLTVLRFWDNLRMGFVVELPDEWEEDDTGFSELLIGGVSDAQSI